MTSTSEQARAAAAIRKELKAKFPETKFRVQSSAFAGGTSVSVEYHGIDPKLLEPILRKYEYGSFNPMDDSYSHDNRNPDLPQAKYVQIHYRSQPL
jgi:hypothetical protein